MKCIDKKELSNLDISYAYVPSHFGEILMASSPKGICFAGFETPNQDTLIILKKRFVDAKFEPNKEPIYQDVLANFFEQPTQDFSEHLHVFGGDFQIKVWNALLQIPFGQTCSYKHIAEKIGHSAAYRAVGSAIGQNPVCLLVPCHRVLRAGGQLGGYMWGLSVKQEILDWESAKIRFYAYNHTSIASKNQPQFTLKNPNILRFWQAWLGTNPNVRTHFFGDGKSVFFYLNYHTVVI